jgi:hypothetical protein
MKWTQWLCACLVAMIAGPAIVQASEGGKPWQVYNRLRLEYDDNIDQSETDKVGSFKVIEELEFLVNFDLQNTFVSLRYRPSYVWWDKRQPDESDFQQDFDLVWNQTFAPRVVLSTVDSLRRGLVPKLVEDNVVIRQNEDNYYNTLNSTLGILLRPETRLEVSGRYVLLRYDNEDVADTEDFDDFIEGLTLRQQLVPETTILADFRMEQLDYVNNPTNGDRGAQSLYLGLGAEQVFSPNLLGTVRGGYQRKDFSDDALGVDRAPYGDLSLTFLPSPATRITAGAGYSLFETDVYPFANQERTQMFASLAHDLTARVAFYLSGAYSIGDYKGTQSVEPEGVKDGSEDAFEVSTRLTYQLNRSNWLEAGWQYQNLDSDLRRIDNSKLRESFDRNRVDLGWKVQF